MKEKSKSTTERDCGRKMVIVFTEVVQAIGSFYLAKGQGEIIFGIVLKFWHIN